MFSLTNILLGMTLMMMWLVSACTVRGGCTTLKVPQPGFAGAMLLTLIAAAGAVATQFGLSMMMGLSFFGFTANGDTVQRAQMLLALPVWMLVCATVYKCMLPTTFGRAMILFVTQALIMAALLVGFTMLANATKQPNLMELRQMLPM